MKKISDIRLKNALDLAEKVGSKAEFARLLGMSDSYMWQILGDKKVRNIGNSIARRMEDACDMPDGWLDAEHIDVDKKSKSVSASATKNIPKDISAQAFQVAQAFDRIQSSAQKKAVIAQLEAFGIWK